MKLFDPVRLAFPDCRETLPTTAAPECLTGVRAAPGDSPHHGRPQRGHTIAV